MKIELTINAEPTVTIYAIPIGTAFIYNKTVYLRTTNGAVQLETGEELRHHELLQQPVFKPLPNAKVVI